MKPAALRYDDRDHDETQQTTLTYNILLTVRDREREKENIKRTHLETWTGGSHQKVLMGKE